MTDDTQSPFTNLFRGDTKTRLSPNLQGVMDKINDARRRSMEQKNVEEQNARKNSPGFVFEEILVEDEITNETYVVENKTLKGGCPKMFDDETCIEMLEDIVEASPNLLILSNTTATSQINSGDVTKYQTGFDNKTYTIEANNNSKIFAAEPGEVVEKNDSLNWHSPGFNLEKTDMPKFNISSPKSLRYSFGNTVMICHETPRNTASEFTKLNNKNFSPYYNMFEPEVIAAAKEISFSSQKNFDESMASRGEDVEVRLMDAEIYKKLSERRRLFLKVLEKAVEDIKEVRALEKDLDKKFRENVQLISEYKNLLD